MKKQNTRRALFMSALSLLLCVSMFVGTTFAWFTDEVKSGTNKIVAGNLDVDVLYEDANGNPASIQDVDTLFNDVKQWEPGAVAWENLTVVNEGSLALRYELALNFKDKNDLEGFVLSDILQVAVVEGGVDESLTREQLISGITQWQSLGDWYENGILFPKGTDGLDSSRVYGVVIYWQPSALDNNWNVQNGKQTSDGQPLRVELGVNLTAWQKDYEKDSFDEKYDAGQGVFHVSNAAELKDALVAGVDVVLVEDILLDDTVEFMNTASSGVLFDVKGGVDVTLDLNGHDIIVTKDAVMAGKKVATAVFAVRNSTMNVVGDGNFIVENQAIALYAWTNGKINIYGGNYISNSYLRSESVVYANNANSVVNVYGGNYLSSPYAFNAHDTNCGTTPVLTLHEGVTYQDFLKNGTTDVTAADINKGRIVVAEGLYMKNYEENGKQLHTITGKLTENKYVSGYEDLTAAKGDGTVVLEGDVQATNIIHMGSGSDATIDLNGQTVIAEKKDQYLFGAQQGSVLRLTGDGNVEAGKGFYANKGGATIIVDNGTYNTTQTGTLNNIKHASLAQNSAKIVINGGTFTTNVEDAVLFYVTSNATLEINGGFFENTADATPDLLGMGTNASNTNRIILKGGTFVNYNPAEDRMCYTGQWPDSYDQFSGPWMLIWDGYKVVSETQANGDIWYTVVPAV